MKIVVDADSCPVKPAIEKVARSFGIRTIMVIDTSHVLRSGYSEIITVSQGKDSVDMALINLTVEGDIVVTQDYGVAAMALSKNAYAINHTGLVFNPDNINRLLFERYLSRKIHRSTGRFARLRNTTKNPNGFIGYFTELCKTALNATEISEHNEKVKEKVADFK